MAEFEDKTDAKPFLEALEKLGACGGGPIFLSNYKNVGDMSRAPYYQSWGAWVLRKVKDRLDTKVRKNIIQKITSPMLAWKVRSQCEYLTDEEDKLLKDIFKDGLPKITNPMTAFETYLRCGCLTDKEDELLENVFRGKLPTAEKELKDGVVRREKDGKL